MSGLLLLFLSFLTSLDACAGERCCLSVAVAAGGFLIISVFRTTGIDAMDWVAGFFIVLVLVVLWAICVVFFGAALVAPVFFRAGSFFTGIFVLEIFFCTVAFFATTATCFAVLGAVVLGAFAGVFALCLTFVAAALLFPALLLLAGRGLAAVLDVVAIVSTSLLLRPNKPFIFFSIRSFESLQHLSSRMQPTVSSANRTQTEFSHTMKRLRRWPLKITESHH